MARLEKAYSALFGSESTKGTLYGGFYTLLGGVFAGLAAVVLLFIAGTQERGSLAMFTWREASFVFAALSGVAIFYGVSITLPSRPGMRIAATVGAALCLGAIGVFLWAYPDHWNVPAAQGDYTNWPVGLYVVGLVLVIAGSFTSLIGYYVGRITAASGASGGASQWAEEYDVPDSVVEKDIEYAMRKYRVAWGEGGAEAATGVQINIQDEFEEGTVVGGGKGVARTVTLETPQVDEATSALRHVRPSKDKTISSEWTEDTTQALLQFRQQKERLVEARRRLPWWQRLLIFLGLRRPPSLVPSAGDGAKGGSPK